MRQTGAEVVTAPPADLPPALADRYLALKAAVNGHGRKLEDEADLIGLYYMVEAGYDYMEAPEVWRVFGKYTKDQSKVSNFFFSDHSTHAARIKNLTKSINEDYRAQVPRSTLRTGEEEYHKACEKLASQNAMANFQKQEFAQAGRALQQVRFPPTRLAQSPGDARNNLFMLPGARYVNPELSWKYESGPAGTTFVRGTALGAEHDGTLWIGSARAFEQVGGTGGSLFRLTLARNRKRLDVSDARLAEGVVDNLTKFDPTESESLIIGKGFGTTPSIEQGPDGNLYVVSITDGTIYKISRR